MRQHENDKVRETAAEALGRIGDEGAVDSLIQALKDENGQVREKAVKALGKIGDERAVEPLLQAIIDEKVDIVVAAKALERIGVREQLTFGFEPLIREREEIERIFRAAGVDAWMSEELEVQYDIQYNKLMDELEFAAVVALGKMGNERVVDPLIQALEDEDRYYQAIMALGKIGNEKTIEPLIQALKDEDINVRKGAAEALGEIGDERAVNPLIEALKDEGEWVRGNATEALGMIGDEKAVEPLIHTLKDEDSNVRKGAAEALGEIGDERAVEPLKSLKKDEKHKYVTDSMKKALENIKKR